MSRIRFRHTTALVALLVLVGGTMLPAEHVHDAPDGHHAPVVHRHVSHAATSPAAAVHAPEGDDHGQELRDAWLAGRPFVLPPADAVAPRLWDRPPPLIRADSAVSAALRVAHGPPLPPRALRGPPLPL